MTMPQAETSAAPSFGWKALAIALLAYTALAIVQTFPLVLRLSTDLPHDLFDPVMSTAILWWNAQVVPFTERWWNGFAFYPAPGFLAFSDPRVGESLIATPLQWLGLNAVAATNLTFLATFPLSAIAAHWLGFVLTRRHDAAAIAGLTYGFSPFRVAHIPHLELLAAFGMPAALASLHLFVATRRRRWLVVFSLALVVQGLCASYYLLFLSVLIGIWLLWFLRPRDLRLLPAIMAAGACAVAALLPLMLGYARIHAHYGFRRSFREIVLFSADATSLFTAHDRMLLWGWTGRWARAEGELFTGATIVLLVIVGAILAWRRSGGSGGRVTSLSRGLLAVAAIAAFVAACGWAFAPWQIEIPGLRMGSDSPFKPMTIALWALVGWLATTAPVRRAWASRSTFAFYVVASIVMFVFSLGPKPAFAGHQFLYEAPYGWLMRIPAFESIRVPARFGMLIMLALATAGALAFARLRLQPGTRRIAAAVLLIGITADSWTWPLETQRLHEVWPASRAEGFTAVMELPLGDLFDDLAAAYRATKHGRPIVNGSSGFEPPHYPALRQALAERDPTAFEWLSPDERILIVVDRRSPAAAAIEPFLVARPGVTPLESDPRWGYYELRPTANVPPVCDAPRAPIASITEERGPVRLRDLTDEDPYTRWYTPHPQRVGDSLVIELEKVARPCSLMLALGEFQNSYPRAVTVETSVDRQAWTVVGRWRTAGMTIKAALDDPHQLTVPIPLEPGPARFITVRMDETLPEIPWQVTEVKVLASPAK